MIKWKKYICIALSATMMASMMTGCGDTSDSSSDKEETTTQESDADVLQEAITSQISADDADDADKEETVFVVADANGENEDITVSTWLKNVDGADGLNDYTTLTDIENVKGYESYQTNDDGTITWQANGNDIYYQGKSTQQLPVDVKVTYMLDGEEIEPEELAGKSGKVTIRFDYTNNTKQKVKAGSSEVEVVSPFVMLSGMILPVDKFSNVQVTNGKVISEGSNQIVVGYAVPGFKECLQNGIDDSKIEEAIDDIDVPDYVEVTADVTDFELAMTMTVAASDLLGDDADEAIDEAKDEIDLDSITDDIDTLADSADQLEEGAGTLTDGLQTLNDGASKLASGAKSVDDNMATLSSGATTVYSGAVQLKTAFDMQGGINDAAKTLSEGVASLNTGINTIVGVANNIPAGIRSNVSSQLGNYGVTIESIDATMASLQNLLKLGETAYNASDYVNTYGNYNNLLTIYTSLAQAQGALQTADSIEKQLSQYSAQIQQLTEGGGQLAAKVGSSDSTDTSTLVGALNAVYSGVTQLARGSKSLSEGAEKLKDGTASLSNGVITLDDGADELLAGSTTLSDGMKQFNEEGIKKITEMFSGNYQTDIDFIEALFSDDAVYTTYGGALDGTSSTVKFIYETGAIKADETE